MISVGLIEELKEMLNRAVEERDVVVPAKCDDETSERVVSF